jgi:hypothetical protein
MSGMPEADYFDDIVVMPHEDDMTMWKVVGKRVDSNAVKNTVIADYIANKPLAEACLRWYCDSYWKKMFEGPRDC